ncbi:MAG: hypothetical protein WCT10_03940 [Patescibacteria group bacterium]|jgi:hypothetical protein
MDEIKTQQTTPSEEKKRRPIWPVFLIIAVAAAIGIAWELTDDSRSGAIQEPAAAQDQAASAISDAIEQPPAQPASRPEPAAQPPAAPGPDLANWVGFADETTGYQIMYPPSDAQPVSNPEVGIIDLQPAIGDKQRTLKIEVLPRTDARADDDGCVDRSLSADKPIFETINGFDYCLVAYNEGAAGSTYRSYVFTTVHEPRELVVFTFTIRYPTSVRIYAGCESDADQAKPFCVEHAFDETRDTALFRHILGTLFHLQK